jgi:hypothetical protein
LVINVSVERSGQALGVGRFLRLFAPTLSPTPALIQGGARERESVRLKILKQCLYLIFRVFDRLSPKKYRPPRPMDVKGGCSPQNNLRKLAASSRACVWSQQISAGTYATSRQLLQQFVAKVLTSPRQNACGVAVVVPLQCILITTE